jgi:hypothetical protein
MTEEKAPEVEQPKDETEDLIPEARLQEILSILLPWGYSHHHANRYTGLSPYIGSTQNIITIVANDQKGWGSVFAIVMERFTEDEDEAGSIGFYKGIMKVIAPELVSITDTFSGGANVLDFDWSADCVMDNRFPVEVNPQQIKH